MANHNGSQLIDLDISSETMETNKLHDYNWSIKCNNTNDREMLEQCATYSSASNRIHNNSHFVIAKCERTTI